MYQPRIVPTESDDIPRFLNEELPRISREMSGPVDYIILNVLNVQPKKPRAGMVVEADGTNWNPGSGAGTYIYRSGSWVKLG